MGDERRILDFTDPDDPYQSRTWFDAEGNFHMEVSADVLTGGDTTEVQAEVQRRADLCRQMLLDFVKPPAAPREDGRGA